MPPPGQIARGLPPFWQTHTHTHAAPNLCESCRSTTKNFNNPDDNISFLRRLETGVTEQTTMNLDFSASLVSNSETETTNK